MDMLSGQTLRVAAAAVRRKRVRSNALSGGHAAAQHSPCRGSRLCCASPTDSATLDGTAGFASVTGDAQGGSVLSSEPAPAGNALEAPHAAAPPAPLDDKVEWRAAVRECLVVGLPVLGAALSEPLLTLVDTWCIGRVGSVLSLAALGINTGLFSFLSNSSAFAVTAVTATMAAALAADAASPPGAPRDRAPLLLGHALGLAVLVGTIVAVALAVFPDAALSAFGVVPGTPLSSASREYLLARIVSVPSIFIMYVSVGGSLGAGSSFGPALGVVAAALLNAAGDAAMVLWLGLGLRGAALATAAASWCGSVLVLLALRRSVAPRFALPTSAQLAPLLAVSGALCAAQLSNSVAYGYTTTASAASGAVAAAAHQIALQLWWLLSYLPIPLYLAAQSLLGRHLAVGDGPRAAAAVRSLMAIGFGLAIALPVANWALPTAFPAAFTSDAAVQAAVASVIPAACAAQALAAINTAAEGCFAGAGRLRYITAISAASAVAGVAFMRFIGGLSGAWAGLLLFEATRTACHAAGWAGFMRELRARAAPALPAA